MKLGASVCVGGRRRGYRDEVNKKARTHLTRQRLGRTAKRSASQSTHVSPLWEIDPSSTPHLGWVTTFSQVYVPFYSCTMMPSCNMSLSMPAANQ